jgi:hypothetical protein
LSGCGGTWWDVSRPALNFMEEILNTYYKCTLSTITHKLNVSWDMLIWILFLILICWTRAQNMSPSLNYTLYSSAKLFCSENVIVNCNSTQCTLKMRVRQGIINKIIKIMMDFFPYNIQILHSHPPNSSLLGDMFLTFSRNRNTYWTNNQ